MLVADRFEALTEQPAATRKPLRWWTQLLARAAWYVLSLGVLAFVTATYAWPWTIVAAAGVAITGLMFHRWSSRSGDATAVGRSGISVLLFLLCIEVGVLICAWQGWRIFGTVGFIGLSLIAFGFGQLMAEIRALGHLRAWIAGFLLLNCTAAIGLSLAGRGGTGLLVAGIALLIPTVALTSEYVTTWLAELNWSSPAATGTGPELRRAVSAEPNGGTVTLRGPLRMIVLAAIGLAVAGLGALWLGDVAGWRLAVIVAVVVLAFVLMVASNTDADVLVLLFVVAVVWSQFPRETEAQPVSADEASSTVVVLGDSYISGEGARSYFAGTNTREADGRNECRRSRHAWASRVFGSRTDTMLDFLACSGAETTNVSASGKGQHVGENPDDEYVSRGDDDEHILSQLEHWARLAAMPERAGVEVQWAFVSVGGNDAGFGDVVADCIAPGDCSLDGQRRLDHLAEALEPRLAELYAELQTSFPGRVAVVPYPVGIVDDAGAGRACSVFRSTFTSRERTFLAGFTRQLNATIRFQAAQHGLRYVAAMEDVFVGRRICETDRANANVNYLALNPVAGDIDPSGWLHNSMHPNEHGHALMAAEIEAWLAQPSEAERPGRVERPSLLLTDVMADGIEYCAVSSSPDGCVAAPSDSSFERLRAAIVDHLAGIVFVFVGGWVIALAVLARRHAVRRPMVQPYSPWPARALGAISSWPRRLGVTVVAVGLPTIAFFVLLDFMVGLEDGYGGAQSSSAEELRALDEYALRTFAAAAVRDMVWFAPAYVVFGIIVVLLTSPRRETSGGPFTWRRGLRWPTWLSLGALVVAGAADVGETSRLRTSLTNLISDRNADVDRVVATTQLLTVVKVVAAAIAVIILVVTIVVRMRPAPARAAATDELLPDAAVLWPEDAAPDNELVGAGASRS